MLETESAATLPPEQLRLILLRWKFFFFLDAALEKFSSLSSLKTLGHMLPYFPVFLLSP